MVTLAVGVNREIPLYCDDCAEVHRYRPGQVERIVYVLIAEAATPDNATSPGGRLVEEYKTCLNEVLRWSYDTEMYYEWTQASVEGRVKATVDCKAHDEYQGPHHHPECHYWDDEMELPYGEMDE